jgi:hypothetical protein
MNFRRKFRRVLFAFASCSVLFLSVADLEADTSSLSKTQEEAALAKGKFMRRERRHHGRRGARGPHGHSGSRGHRGREGHHGRHGLPGVQGLQGVHGLQGNQGEQGVRGALSDLPWCTSGSFTPESLDSFKLYACTLASAADNKQFLQPAPLFQGYVPPGSPVTFTGFVKGNYPLDLDSTIEGKFKIQAEGAGQYLIHYGLVGVPNGVSQLDAKYSLLAGDFLNTTSGVPPAASCWICVKITHLNGVSELLGATPLSFTSTLNAQNIPQPQPVAPNNYSPFILAGFGQISAQLTPGDEVTMMIMLASEKQNTNNVPFQDPAGGSGAFRPNDVDNRILHIQPFNTIYRWETPAPANAQNLSGGATLSLIRMGT